MTNARATDCIALADKCETLLNRSVVMNGKIKAALPYPPKPWDYTDSLDAARGICPSAMLVFASDIGADGLPMVKLVLDTSTTPVKEYTGIGHTLVLAWCAASLRAHAAIIGKEAEPK